MSSFLSSIVSLQISSELP